ncbi:ribonuclease HI [Neorhizobium sp. 2083]|uniref:ribonuclease H family protein n=1 Tax=Neorhizobium sp. 2083 TaxID=2817762 RepID=UPI00285682FE|nr:ribonuclease H [Neorhizobium sp. 2083]MDR6816267.1 ribonuclease HI [Neorhizobium sp. 2083]
MTSINSADRATIVAGRHYLIATDGSCISNPGPGGWAVVKQLRHGDQLLQQAPNAGRSQSLMTTNNQMEMMAVIMAVEGIREPETPTIIQADSAYVLDGFTVYLPNWKTNGWKVSKGKVQNRDLWERLDAACAGKTIYWEKIKGHSGHGMNEITDVLAKKAAIGKLPKGQASIRKQHPELFFRRP